MAAAPHTGDTQTAVFFSLSCSADTGALDDAEALARTQALVYNTDLAETGTGDRLFACRGVPVKELSMAQFGAGRNRDSVIYGCPLRASNSEGARSPFPGPAARPQAGGPLAGPGSGTISKGGWRPRVSPVRTGGAYD